jgi:hypothetical protein
MSSFKTNNQANHFVMPHQHDASTTILVKHIRKGLQQGDLRANNPCYFKVSTHCFASYNLLLVRSAFSLQTLALWILLLVTVQNVFFYLIQQFR